MATRFWVGGTGTWDASDTTHWAASTGAAGGQSVPGSSDTVTLDGASGGGTVTVNTTVTVQSITCGAFTGTLDFSANNNSVTLSATSAFSGTGSATRTINLGNGTWTINTTAGSTPWNMNTTTGLTFNANSSTINLSGATTVAATFGGGGLTYNAVTFGAIGTGGARPVTGANTFTTLTVTGQNAVNFNANNTITTLNLNGTSTGQIGISSNSLGTPRTLTITTLSASWSAFRDIAGSGSATNSFDVGGNTGITITAPSSGGGGISRARAASGF